MKFFNPIIAHSSFEEGGIENILSPVASGSQAVAIALGKQAVAYQDPSAMAGELVDWFAQDLPAFTAAARLKLAGS